MCVQNLLKVWVVLMKKNDIAWKWKSRHLCYEIPSSKSHGWKELCPYELPNPSPLASHQLLSLPLLPSLAPGLQPPAAICSCFSQRQLAFTPLPELRQACCDTPNLTSGSAKQSGLHPYQPRALGEAQKLPGQGIPGLGSWPICGLCRWRPQCKDVFSPRHQLCHLCLLGKQKWLHSGSRSVNGNAFNPHNHHFR